MKRKLSIRVAIVFVAGLTIATLSFAQMGMGQGWERGSRYAMMYNPQTVETLAGEVTRVDKFTPMHGMSTGIHLMVKTNKETISVHLGPARYIESQDVRFEPG
ncbi:MAG: DNA-binding protein, partial [Rhodanobacteraceae bacterium]